MCSFLLGFESSRASYEGKPPLAAAIGPHQTLPAASCGEEKGAGAMLALAKQQSHIYKLKSQMHISTGHPGHAEMCVYAIPHQYFSHIY